jgi:hypothetical protein
MSAVFSVSSFVSLETDSSGHTKCSTTLFSCSSAITGCGTSTLFESSF